MANRKVNCAKDKDPVRQFAWTTSNINRLRKGLAYRARLVEEPDLETLQVEAQQLRRMLENNMVLQQLSLKIGTTYKCTSQALENLKKEGNTMFEVAIKQNLQSSPFTGRKLKQD